MNTGQWARNSAGSTSGMLTGHKGGVGAAIPDTVNGAPPHMLTLSGGLSVIAELNDELYRLVKNMDAVGAILGVPSAEEGLAADSSPPQPTADNYIEALHVQLRTAGALALTANQIMSRFAARIGC